MSPLLSEYEQRVLAEIELDLTAQSRQVTGRRRRLVRAVATLVSLSLAGALVGLSFALSGDAVLTCLAGILLGAAVVASVALLPLARWRRIGKALRHPRLRPVGVRRTTS